MAGYWDGLADTGALTRTQVQQLQRALVARGYSVGPTGADGAFGPNTLRALQSFQRAQGLNLRYDYNLDQATAAALGLNFYNWQGVGTGSTGTGSGSSSSSGSGVAQAAGASALALLASAPAVVPLAMAGPLGFAALAGAAGMFVSTTGVVYRLRTDGTGQQLLEKTNTLIADAAKDGLKVFLASLGITTPIAILGGAVLAALLLRK